MPTSAPASTIVAALGDPSGWLAGGGPAGHAALVGAAEIPAPELAAILLSLEDRAEELYRVATGRHAPSCMIATAWLYGTPFCRTAADEIARRGEDLRWLKEAAIGVRRRGGDPLDAASRDWLV